MQNILAVGLFSCFLSIFAHAADYTINIAESLQDTRTSVELQNFLAKVYSQVGITPKFVYLPIKRSHKFMLLGKVHAEAVRTREIGDSLENIVRLEPSIAITKVALICLNRELCVTDNTLNYAIPSGFEKGRTICDELGLNCEFIQKPSILAKMLEANVIDAVLLTPSDIERVFCVSRSTNLFYRFIANYDLALYHYVSSTDAQLIQALQASIVKVLQSEPGKLERFYAKPDLSFCNKTLRRID
jgi:polar amino acid transport system substrate-binding protein